MKSWVGESKEEEPIRAQQVLVASVEVRTVTAHCSLQSAASDPLGVPLAVVKPSTAVPV